MAKPGTRGAPVNRTDTPEAVNGSQPQALHERQETAKRHEDQRPRRVGSGGTCTTFGTEKGLTSTRDRTLTD